MHIHDILMTMRTTVEMKPEHRSALIALAKRRGQMGFSAVLAEAIDFYLAAEHGRAKRRAKFLSYEGLLSEEEGEVLGNHAARMRTHWR